MSNQIENRIKENKPMFEKMFKKTADMWEKHLHTKLGVSKLMKISSFDVAIMTKNSIDYEIAEIKLLLEGINATNGLNYDIIRNKLNNDLNVKCEYFNNMSWIVNNFEEYKRI